MCQLFLYLLHKSSWNGGKLCSTLAVFFISIHPIQNHRVPLKKPFCNSSSSLCPHLLLWDWCSVKMNDGSYLDSTTEMYMCRIVHKMSLCPLYFAHSMYICLLSLKEAYSVHLQPRHMEKQITGGEITAGEVVECRICILEKKHTQTLKDRQFSLH